MLLLLLPQPAMDEAGLDIVDFVDVGIEVRGGDTAAPGVQHCAQIAELLSFTGVLARL